MSLSSDLETAERVPLIASSGGVILMAGTRVPLDTVVEAFAAGKSAAEIALAHTTLDLAALYTVLAFYLRHRTDVDSYVAERRRDAETLRTQIELDFDPRGIRERLLSRQPAKQP